MLEITDLTLMRGGEALLIAANLTAHPGQRVGLCGANGCGKSSLFSAISGQLTIDQGSLSFPDSWIIAQVQQETPSSPTSALDYVIDGDTNYRRIEHAIATNNDDSQLGHLYAEMEAVHGYDIQSRAERLLAGLGFKSNELQRPVSDFSGGWRMRLNLAQALICQSDLLVLDEPTNHLDLDSVLWLETWLKSYPGTLLLISHDRSFLDAVVNQVAFIEGQTIDQHRGNFSDFERYQVEKLAQHQASYENQQREIAHIQSFVSRFRAQASKAKQAQSRLKALERMEQLAPLHSQRAFQFTIPDPISAPDPLLKLHKATLGYPDKVILSDVSLTLRPGDRLSLLGRNGAGKSTLIKTLANQIKPLGGELTQADDLQIGYYSQHQLEQLDPAATAAEHLLQLNKKKPVTTEQEIRDYLGRFGFHGDRAFIPIAPFSGGEKARLALALLVWKRPNLLLMDEPTNHLDLGMREALAIALQTYQGALVIISHDQQLLETVTGQFYLVDEGQCQPFDGDMNNYKEWLQAKTKASPKKVTAGSKPSGSSLKESNRQRRSLEQKVRRQEEEVEKLQAQLETLNKKLADPQLYQAGQQQEAEKLNQQSLLLSDQIATSEQLWLDLSEQLDELESTP